MARVIAIDVSGSMINKVEEMWDKAQELSQDDDSTVFVTFANKATQVFSLEDYMRTVLGGGTFLASILPFTERAYQVVVLSDGEFSPADHELLINKGWKLVTDFSPAEQEKERKVNTMQYSIVNTEDGANITVFVKGRGPLVAHSNHPAFEQIRDGVLAGDESVLDLFDAAKSAAAKFERLSDRVTTANGRLYLDGEEVDNALATQVVRFLGEGVEDWKPLVKFFENVQANPNEHSREQLFDWLEKREFTITDEGNILGYKGVKALDDGTFESISTGTATVDGETFTGAIPNKLGSIVEMPRNSVEWNPAVGCHTGLHVGTYEYASDFARGALLEVHVNPRDVVSVPTDCDWQKMRVCRYTVVGAIDAPYTSAVVFRDDAWEEGDGDHGWDNDGCVCCGEEPEPDDDFCSDCIEDGCDSDRPRGRGYDGPRDDDGEEEVVESLEAEFSKGVTVGDVYEDRDSRRQGRTFKVESIEGDYAVGKSLPQNVTRKVRLDRLTSGKYRKQ